MAFVCNRRIYSFVQDICLGIVAVSDAEWLMEKSKVVVMFTAGCLQAT